MWIFKLVLLGNEKITFIKKKKEKITFIKKNNLILP